MKAQFLKIAGVKTDKEFYDKYPTEEEFFAKCGAKIKKAFPGMTIPKAQAGANIFQNNTFQQPLGAPASSATPGIMPQIGQGLQALGGSNPIQKVFDTVQGFKAQKENVNRANQNMQVMGFMEDAKASNDRDQQYNLQQARQQGYVRPEDNMMTGEELFPMYGVGTNVLKKGGTIKAQTGWAGFGQQALGTGINMGMQALNLGDNDMGSQLGGDIGGIAGGLIGGPLGNKIGSALGTVAGGLIDRSDSKIKKYNNRANQSINNMIGMDMGNYTRNRFGGNLKNGGTMKYADGGDIQVNGKGSLSPISDDMFMINGPSHGKGGVNMNIMGQPVEAEGREPIQIMEDGGNIDGSGEEAVIFGNLKPPKEVVKAIEEFSGENITGKKYKNIAKTIGETKEKYNKKKINVVNNAENLTDLNPIDRISLNSIDLMKNAYDKKVNKLDAASKTLGEIQELQNLEEEQSAKNGKKVYAQTGVSKKYRPQEQTGDGMYGGVTPEDLEEFKTRNRWYKDIDSYDPNDKTSVGAFQKAFNAKIDNPNVAGLKVDELHGIQTNSADIAMPVNASGLKGFKPNIQANANIKPFADPIVVNEKDKSNSPNWWQGLNLMGSDAEDFNNAQLLPEVWAMANNQLEPVQAQKYQARLRTPYDISMQDQLNQTTAKARGAERMAAYNPGMLASLKAEEYMADQTTLGNQFRQNQGFKDQVYSGNLNTINDMNLKNLGIGDQQYVRQQQALSNTKATDLEAIKSMTDKRLKHNLENQTVRVMENMYDYRYDPAGRAQYRGEGWNPSDGWGATGGSSGNTNWPPKGYEFVYDQSGRPIDVRKSKNASDQAWQTPGIVSRNGSIVKSYKKFK